MLDTHTPTLKQLYDSVLRQYETAPSVTFEGETLTYGTLDERSARLADYERPKSFDVVEELPTTPYGKLDKKRLREPYWEDQSREIR